MSQPNFDNLLKVLINEVPDKPPILGFVWNMGLHKKLAEKKYQQNDDGLGRMKFLVNAFLNAFHDYVSACITNFSIAKFDPYGGKSILHYDHTHLEDRKSFEQFSWPDSEGGSYHVYEEIDNFISKGAKLVVPAREDYSKM